MRNFGRKLLTASFAALYGSIALLGYGLHELAPAHHHTSAAGQPHAHSHAGRSHHHHHAHAPIPEQPGWSDSHDCDICQFLAQSLSEPPQLAAVSHRQPLAAKTTTHSPRLNSQAIFGLHVPRGPPLLLV